MDGSYVDCMQIWPWKRKQPVVFHEGITISLRKHLIEHRDRIIERHVSDIINNFRNDVLFATQRGLSYCRFTPLFGSYTHYSEEQIDDIILKAREIIQAIEPSYEIYKVKFSDHYYDIVVSWPSLRSLTYTLTICHI